MTAWLIAFVTCSCPDGWYVATVRPSGVYACARVPRLGVCDEKRGCDDQRPDERVWLLAWCGDATPVNVDSRRVVCLETVEPSTKRRPLTERRP